jgi:hypothetical protein
MKYLSALKQIGLFFAISGIGSCQPPTCQLRYCRTLYIAPMRNGEEAESYFHYVLLEGFVKECLDSATVVAHAVTYRDTVTGKRPIAGIGFYSSADRFTPGGIPNALHQDADCLVKILFDTKTTNPTDFVFFDEEGNIRDRSWTRWLPGNSQ